MTRILRPVLAAIFFLALLVGGCKKKNEGIGAGVLPEGELLGMSRVDTTTVLSRTLLDDSVRVDGLEFPRMLLGAMNDLEFGTTKASFYTQVKLSATQVDFTEEGSFTNIQADSIVLSLAYASDQYGFDYPQQYEVYELNEQLYKDSVYFAPFTLSTSSQDLVLPESRNQRPAPDQPVYLADDTLSPQLRLRLNNSLAERILNQANQDSLNSDLFTQFIKGFFVTVDDQVIPPNNGGVHYFDPLSVNTKMTLYYTGVKDATDTLHKSFDLLINSAVESISSPTHEYTSANVELQNQLAQNTFEAAGFAFIQAGAGLKVQVELPFLTAYSSDTMAINRAELVIPFESNSIFPPPGRLFAIGKDADDIGYFLPDFLEGDAHFNGYIDPINEEYRINISRWVQQIVSGTREPGRLELVSELAGSSANRVILSGPQHPSRQMRVILHYTKF